MPFFVLSAIIQVLLVLHIIKTKRSTTWIWVVVIVPLAGSIAYFVIEVLPELAGSRTGRKAQKNITNLINPEKALKEAATDFSISDTVENSLNLAEECLSKEMYAEAKQLFEKSLKGIHKEDPAIMYGLARAEYGLENHNETKRILDNLIEKNPDYKNPDAHLLYACSLEALDQTDAALHEYEVLENYYPGPEAACRYGLLLKRLGQKDKANEMFDKVLHRSSFSGRHYNDIHKHWIKTARSELTR